MEQLLKAIEEVLSWDQQSLIDFENHDDACRFYNDIENLRDCFEDYKKENKNG